MILDDSIVETYSVQVQIQYLVQKKNISEKFCKSGDVLQKL